MINATIQDIGAMQLYVVIERIVKGKLIFEHDGWRRASDLEPMFLRRDILTATQKSHSTHRPWGFRLTASS